jgi:tetratricopeptide (TPR) repeat protein
MNTSIRHVSREFVVGLLLLCIPLQGSQHKTSLTSSAEAKRLFSEGQNHLRQGNLEAAERAVLHGLKLSPQGVDGYNLLGIIYTQQKNYEKSLAAFQQALKLAPNSSEIHNNLGKSYLAQEKLELAARQFRAALNLDPKHRDANYNLGLVLLAQGLPEQAISSFQRVQPPDTSTLLNLSQAFLRAGQSAQGLDLARKISDQDKNNVQLHFSLGVLLASEKQYSAAQEEFELADSLMPRTFEILHNLGQAYLRNSNYAKAEMALDRALTLRPNSAETMHLLAQAHFSQRKEAAALELLVRARKLAPENADIISLLARLFMSQSFYEDAIQLLEEGIKVAPQRADLHASLGECYFSTVKLDRAIQEFQTSIRLEPSARSYALLGTCYRQLGRFDEAKKSLNEGLKLNPEDVACLYNLGYMESKQDNLREAEQLLRRAVQVNPNHSEALYELASLNMIGGRYEEAVSLLQRCAQLTSKPARVYYKLTIAQRRLNRLEAAERDLKIFQTLSKDPPPSPYPFQRFFEYLDQRAEMSAQEKTEFDLQELLLELKQQPDQPRKLYLVAEAYLRLGQAEEAKRVVERLHTVSGGDYRTSLAVGVLLARYRLYSEAIEHFQMALKGNPASDEAKYNLANAHFQIHEYPQALGLLQQVSNAARNDDAYLSLLADIHSRLGHRLEATKAFQEAIALSPDRDQY